MRSCAGNFLSWSGGDMLTPKQEKFVRELVKGKSQRAAYKAAYSAKNMSDKTIDCKASRLFRQDKIKARYNQILENVTRAAEYEALATKQNVIAELAKLAFSSVGDCVEIVNGTVEIKNTADISEETLKTIASIKEGANGIEIKFHSKVRALELLGKYLNLFDKDW